MFEAKTSKGAIIRKLFDVLHDLVKEINLDVSTTGIAMQAMDASHVALCTFVLHAAEFDVYRCDRAQKIGLKMKALHKIMKCSGPNDSFSITTGDDSDSVTFIFQNPNDDSISRFKLFQCDIDSESLWIPDQDFKASFEMSASRFQRICRDLGSLGDSMQISVTKAAVSFGVDGELGEGSVALKGIPSKEEGEKVLLEDVIVQVVEPLHMNLAVNFLNYFAKAAGLDSNQRVTCRLTHEAPLCVQYDLPESLGQLSFYLAPKMDEADGEAEGGEGMAADAE